MDFVCPVCGCTEYYESHEKGGRVRRRCRECQQKRMKIIYASEDYKKKHRAYARLHRRNYPEELFNLRLKEQDSRCAICGEKCEETKIFADHDHITGKPRGLLCNRCNIGCGVFRDNVEYMKKAIAYLEKWDNE